MFSFFRSTLLSHKISSNGGKITKISSLSWLELSVRSSVFQQAPPVARGFLVLDL